MTYLLTNLGRLANLFLLLTPFFLAGCTVGPWERDFWHPPAATGAVPIKEGPVHPITRATGEGAGDWPNLNYVPDRPAPPATSEELAAQVGQLERDRTSAAGANPDSPPAGGTDMSLPSTAPTPPPLIED